MPRENQTWKSVRDEFQQRIQTRIWAAGTRIPNEEDLASELGCARVTVNRALRDLAEQGILDRRRKAGTWVAEFPTRNVRFNVPILRKEIEDQGAVHGYALLARSLEIPPAPISAAMQIGEGHALHLKALHLSDGRPFVFEDRWINLGLVPEAEDVDFAILNANEWLVRHVPLTRGDMTFGAVNLSEELAASLGAETGASALTNERLTWERDQAVTHVTLTYRPGHRLRTGF